MSLRYDGLAAHRNATAMRCTVAPPRHPGWPVHRAQWSPIQVTIAFGSSPFERDEHYYVIFRKDLRDLTMPVATAGWSGSG
jgi:hypothetical protein